MPAGPSSLGNRQAYGGPTVKPKSATADAGVPPLIGSAGAPHTQRAPGQGLIPIEGAARVAVKHGVHKDPFAFWMDYYKKHDEWPGELKETIRLLGANGRMRDVEATLKGYLWNRPNNAEAWMYLALEMAIRVNGGSPAEMQQSLNFAADLAQRTHNPNDLVEVADKLLLRGQLDRVGPLLDEAAAKIPHRNDPLRMSVLLAQQQKDPARMGDAIEKLLALGWPGEDDFIRAECRRQADLLAKALREDGRAQDADALLARLAASEARDVFIRLTWDGYADFDLAVDEPLGVTASYDLPRTVFGGSIIKNGFGSHPEEVYVCPRGFDGDYTVHIRTIFTDEKKPVVRLKLETIVHEGTPQEQKNAYVLQPDQLNKTFVVHLSGGRRKTVLPYVNVLKGRLEFQALSRPTAKHSRASRGTGAGGPGRDAKARGSAKGEVNPRP
jgi:hypothetical protein